MRSIERQAKPSILDANEVTWRQEYVDWVANGSPGRPAAATRYRHPEIKQAVKAETFDKCAYCEARVTHVYPGDVEHIVPKSHEPALVVEWTNLTFACIECNRRKSDYFNPAEPILDPFEDAPEDHLDFHGPMVFNAPGSITGYVTRRRLELNRPALLHDRSELLQRVQDLLDRAASATPVVRDFVLAELADMAEPEAEYSAMVAEVLDRAAV